jgi:signal transduction histidine kinase
MVASLLLLAWFEIWIEPIFQTGMPGPRVPLTVAAAVAVVPLLARRVYPLAALGVMALGMVTVGLIGEPEQATFVLLLALLIGTYSLAAYATLRHAILGAGLLAGSAAIFETATFEGKALIDVLVSLLFIAAAWFTGHQVQRQRERAAELADHAALLARSHRLEMHAAVVAERTRIARELHDVVAHAISVMGIQAGAARRTLAPGQQAQREALLDVERLGREALDEMQRMLGVLRTGEDEQGMGPLPDLGQVPVLVEDVRRAGTEVELAMDDELPTLPTGLQLTAYRIVQEALTNVCKHAEASRVRVRLARCDDELAITVDDDGVGVAGEPTAGNGLIGMRERIAMHHGTLQTGPGAHGGFVVRARLPIEAAR